MTTGERVLAAIRAARTQVAVAAALPRERRAERFRLLANDARVLMRRVQVAWRAK